MTRLEDLPKGLTVDGDKLEALCDRFHVTADCGS
jgi:hypothetical protein